MVMCTSKVYVKRPHRQDHLEQCSKLRQSNGRHFFPQPDFQVPEEEVGQHPCEHMVVPSTVFSHFAVIQAQVVLGLLEALLDRPTHSFLSNQFTFSVILVQKRSLPQKYLGLALMSGELVAKKRF